MNRQTGYIIQAFLLAGLFFLIYFLTTSVSVSKPPVEHVNKGTTTVTSVINKQVGQGKMLFMKRCAACHNMMRGHDETQFNSAFEREPWTNRKNLYAWIRNPEEFIKTNEYTRELVNKYKALMQANPDLSNEEIDRIVEYVLYTVKIRGY